MYFLFKLNSRALPVPLLLLSIVAASKAQSLDITAPSPIRTNQTVGTIAARDLGDSRLTNHYYIFAATLGDLIVTVETSNLNGDIDIFTAGSLRPLLKFTTYAESASPITKTVFLRKREDLILRVQARSPNDDHGTYHIRFSGTFEPVTGGSLLSEKEAESVEKPLTAAVDPKVRRVSSVGARIEEPEPPPSELAETTPEPTPEAKPSEVVTEAPEVTSAPSEGRRQPSRRRGRRPPAAVEARGAATTEPKEEAKPDLTPVEEAKEAAKSEPKPAEEIEKEAASDPRAARKNEALVSEDPSKAEAEEPAKPAGRTAGRRGRTPQPAVEVPDPESPVGPRLIIETRDGVRIERYMSTIRRVTVERNQIVVVGSDGKIERTTLSDVLRMTIEP